MFVSTNNIMTYLSFTLKATIVINVNNDVSVTRGKVRTGGLILHHCGTLTHLLEEQRVKNV